MATDPTPTNVVNDEPSSVSPLKQENIASPTFKLLLGLYLLAMSLIIMFLIYVLWPTFIPGQGKLVFEKTFSFFNCVCEISDEARLILLVILSGGLGSILYASSSFVHYVGNDELGITWKWWYVLRPFIGGSLALIFYFMIRGGLLSAGTDSSSISVFGLSGISGLVGMFSKNAIEKLREVFETFFRTKDGKGDDARNNSITPAPQAKKP